jgi:CDK-activating kinase assembly factor MAT1
VLDTMSSSSAAAAAGATPAALEVETLRDAGLCVKCRSDDSNYLDPLAKLAWARTCRHGLCERCRRDLFARHRTNRCPLPGCGDTVTQSDYVGETREAAEFRRECDVRKRLGRVFNKRLADFGGDSAAYNDYLETVEGHVATLVAGAPDEVQRAETAIAAYQAEHARLIAANAAAAAEQARREAAAAKAAAEARAGAAARSAREAAERHAAAEALRRRLLDVLSAVREGGPALSQATRESYKAELAALRAALTEAQAAQTAAAAAASAAVSGAGGAAGSGGPQAVPCAAIFPPRLVAEVNAALAALALPAVPPAIVARQHRAGGLLPALRHAWAADELVEELWCGGGAAGGVDAEPG